MSRRRHTGSPLSLFAFQDIITATTGILILITLILCLSISRLPLLEADTTQDVSKIKLEIAALESEIESLKLDSERMQKTAVLLVGMANTDLNGSVEASSKSLQRLAMLVSQARSDLSNMAKTLEESAEDREILQAEQLTLQKLLREIENRRAEFEHLNSSDRIVYNFRNAGAEVPWLLEIAGDKLVVARSGKKEAPRIFDHGSIRQRLSDFDAWLNKLPANDRYFVALIRPSGAEVFGAIRQENSVRALLDRAKAGIGIDLILETQEVINNAEGAGF